jgi:hypothetical protein
MPESCLADQAAILRLVNYVVKKRIAPNAKLTLTSFVSNNPRLLDGINRIATHDIVNGVANGIIVML